MSTPAPGHTHRLPTWLLATLVVIVLGLVGGIAIVSYQAVETNRRLSALEDYVNGKGAQRDVENARLNQRITDAVCNVLDQLPAGGHLDAVRASYGCGPGLPPGLPPGEGVAARSQPRTLPAPATTTPASPTGGVEATPGAPPAVPSSAAPPAPTPSSPPSPGLVCSVLHLFCPSS